MKNSEYKAKCLEYGLGTPYPLSGFKSVDDTEDAAFSGKQCPKQHSLIRSRGALICPICEVFWKG